MKVLITGNYGLGKNIKETLIEACHEVLCISAKNDIQNIINEYDVFVNNEYINKIQTDLFELVYNEWKYKPKTIINILTSAIIFGGPNQKYIDDKKDLEKRTFELRNDSKKVRIINIYPNTLESSKLAKNQKLNYTDVSNIIKYVIELPQDIEIFQIGISKTTLEIKKSII